MNNKVCDVSGFYLAQFVVVFYWGAPFTRYNKVITTTEPCSGSQY